MGDQSFQPPFGELKPVADKSAYLTPDDVKQDGDIWYLELGTDEDSKQHVKNETSARQVPICQKIIDRGFIAYVKRVKKLSKKENPGGRLWPSLTYCEKNGWIKKPSRYFNTTVKPAIGAKDNRSGLHALRSNVARVLQTAEVEQRTIDELLGHQPSGISPVALGYQGKLHLGKLLKAVELLDWEKDD